MNRKITILGIILTGLLLLVSCKPKQSTYREVYEAAQEKKMGENDENKLIEEEEIIVKDRDLPKPMTLPTYPNTNNTSETSTPVKDEPVRKEKVTVVNQNDVNNLKAYNIVIAAMGMKPNAESLKTRMEAEGYKIILVQNEQGMYRVVIGSYADKADAVANKNEILSNFSAQGDQASLRSKFGIPFNDWWILQRDY